MSTPPPATGLAASGEAADAEFRAQPADRGVTSCTQQTWIDVRLVDENQEPIRNEPYRLELPDGRVIDGTTDGDGLAGFDGFDPGQCRLSFPNRRAVSTRVTSS